MVISVDKLRRNLDGASIQAHVTQQSLRQVIADHLYDRFQASNSGRKLAGISANGQSTTISSDQSDLMLEVWSQLLSLFDTCKASLVAAGDDSADEDVVTEMKYRLGSESVTTIRHDFTLSRSDSDS